MKIQQAQHTPVVPFAEGGALSKAAACPMPELHGASLTVASSSQRAVHEAVTVALSRIASASDPMSFIQRLQIAQRDGAKGAQEVGIKSSNDKAMEAEKARAHAMKKAQEGSGFLGLGGVLGDIVKVVAGAAAAASAVATGGATAGLIVAGAALMLGGDKIADAAVELGVISKDDAKYLSIGIQITGALLSFGAGIAGAVSTAESVGTTAAKIADVADAIGVATNAVGTANNAAMAGVTDFVSSNQIAAKGAVIRRDAHNADASAALSDMQSLMSSYGRVAEKFASIRTTRNEMQMAAVRTLA